VAGARHDNGPAAPAVLDRVARIERVCAAHGVSLRAAALQFPLAHPAVTGLVAGSRSAAEVRQNLDYLRRPLPAVFWDELRHEKLIDPAAPTPLGT
jgi:D-threo-aldose 1-dehydrogenase